MEVGLYSSLRDLVGLALLALVGAGLTYGIFVSVFGGGSRGTFS